MSCPHDDYARHPVPVQARLYSEENRRAARRPAPAAPAPEPARPILACPDCARAGHPGRIGSRRTDCAACNRFAAAVRAEERRRALASLPDAERQRHHDAAELTVYARHHPGRPPITSAPSEEV